MSAESVAADHYRTQQQLANAAAQVAAGAWGQVDQGNIAASWSSLNGQVTVAVVGAQQAAAGQADAYLDGALSEQGIPTGAEGQVNARAFAGVASDGRPLDSLIAQPANVTLAALGSGHTAPRAMAAGQASLDMIVRTQVADAGRAADQVSLVAHRSVSGYVRLLAPPSCARCAILAGRWYRYSSGFARHPRCDCRHIPSIEGNADDLTTDPRAYFDSLSRAEQDRLFTKDGAQAIRDGADINQVVNARRGMHTAGGRRLTRESTTRFGTARPGRLMPEEIYLQARSRAEAIDLLREHGYLRGGPVRPGAGLAGPRQARLATTTLPLPAPRVPVLRAPAVGRDVTPELDLRALDREVVSYVRLRGNPGQGDQVLKQIQDANGFNGLPQLVSSTEMDALVSSGRQPLYRGIPPEFAEQFKRGAHYPGLGVAGNGTYSTTNRSYALDYARRNEDGLIRMTLHPGARVTTIENIEREMAAAGIRPSRVGQETLVDQGRWAAAHGYDAYRVPVRTRENEEYWVVLNRTALIVEV